MRLDWWTLGLQTINLLVLVWILNRVFFQPIARIIARRQAAATDLLHKAEAEHARAGEEEEQARKEEEAAEAARGNVLETAAAAAKSRAETIIAEARKEADALRAEVREENARWKKSEQTKAEARATQLAVDITRKTLERLPDTVLVDSFLPGLAEAVNRLPDAARAEIGADGSPVQVRSARRMTPKEIKACEKTLSKALGRDVTIAASTDPAVIAGLEIESAHSMAQNSLRADLTQITSELTSDGGR